MNKKVQIENTENGMNVLKGALAIISLVIFILLCVLVAQNLIGNFDSRIQNFFLSIRSDGLTHVMKFLTTFGSVLFAVILLLVLLIIKKTRFRYGIPLAINAVITEIFVEVIKLIIGRERPDVTLSLVHETSKSFPSGHTAFTVMFCGTLFFLLNRFVKEDKIRIPLKVFCVFMIAIVGITRIYLYAHYPSDVLAGFALAGTILFTNQLLYDRYKISEKVIKYMG